MKKFACLLIAVLSLVNVMAQITTASLRGVVKNQSNEILVGATVVLSHPITGSSYAVATDVQGRYSLHGRRPSDGSELEVSYVGYQT